MKLFVISLFLLSSISLTEAQEKTGRDAIAVDNACAQDGVTAGCGTEKVGTGLLKCLHAYKKAHKDFKLAANCKAAIKTRQTNKTMRNGKKAKLEAQKQN